MALAFNLTWQDTTKDSQAESLGFDMGEDLFDDRVWIYLTPDAIKRRLNKLMYDNLGLAYATAYELHMRNFSSLDDFESESFRR